PPERRPGENNETRPALSQPFEFLNCALIVCRTSPILSFMFKKWDNLPTVNQFAHSPLLFIGQNDRVSAKAVTMQRWNGLSQFLYSRTNALLPRRSGLEDATIPRWVATSMRPVTRRRVVIARYSWL